MFKHFLSLNKQGFYKLTIVSLAAAGLSACNIQSSGSKPRTLLTDTNVTSTDFEISRIIGGKAPGPDSLFRKYTVGVIGSTAETLCTGTIIGPRLILTASHCVRNNEKLNVFFGPTVKDQGVVLPVKKIAYNKKFDTTQKLDLKMDQGDIALLLLESEIPSTHAIAPMAPADFIPTSKNYFFVAGYGKSHRSDFLEAGALKFSAVRIYEREFGVSEFVMDQSENRGVCFGDMGGPAYGMINDTLHVVGIASRIANPNGDPCRGLAIYSNVGIYQTFISQSIEQLMADSPSAASPDTAENTPTEVIQNERSSSTPPSSETPEAQKPDSPADGGSSLTAPPPDLKTATLSTVTL